MATTSNSANNKSTSDRRRPKATITCANCGGAHHETYCQENGGGGMKKVTVHRTERFIEPTHSTEPAADVDAANNGNLSQCPNCEGFFLESAVAENDGYCPGCGRDADGNPEETADEVLQQLSEEDIALAEIENNEGKYKLRVERLLDYHVNGQTDSRARKEFCVTIEPLTRDWIDRVQAAYGGGDYWFTIYERGRPGIVRAFHRSIAKPLQPLAEPQPSTLPVAAQKVGPTVDRLREAVEKAVAKRIEDILDGNVTTPAVAQEPQPRGPEDEEMLVAKHLFKNPNVVDGIARRFQSALGAEPEHWSAPLIKEGVKYLPDLFGFLRALTVGAGGPPQELKDFLKVIVDELTHGRPPQRAAIYTKDFLKRHPQHQATLSLLANQSATELLLTLSQADPAYAHVRALPYASQWIEDFKALLLSPAPPQPAPAPTPPAEATPQPNVATPAPDTSAPNTVPPAAPAFARLLRHCAADMARSDSDEENGSRMDESFAVAETIQLVSEFPEFRPQLDLVLAATPEQLVALVATRTQDTALMHHPGAVLWAKDYQSSLRIAIVQEPPPEEPASPATEAIQ